MKIAIMSDSHDRWEILEKAINMANEAGCEHLLFAGDLIAPPGVAILEKFNGVVKFVWGNNEGEIQGLTTKFNASEKIELCGDIFDSTIAGVRVFMNHYPEIGSLAAKSKSYDLCVYGHDHTYHSSKVGETVLVNPGAITPYGNSVSTFIIFDTESREVERIEL